VITQLENLKARELHSDQRKVTEYGESQGKP